MFNVLLCGCVDYVHFELRFEEQTQMIVYIDCSGLIRVGGAWWQHCDDEISVAAFFYYCDPLGDSMNLFTHIPLAGSSFLRDKMPFLEPQPAANIMLSFTNIAVLCFEQRWN